MKARIPGERIGKQHAEHDRERGYLKRIDERLMEMRSRNEGGKILRRPFAHNVPAGKAPQAIARHQNERRHEEGRRPS